jgi:OOP family OmpA-OmpF porin
MSRNLRTLLWLPVGLALFASIARPAEDAGWYLGGNLGDARARIEEQKIRDDLLGSGFTLNSFSKDESHIGFKLFGGYQFGTYFALEGGYFNPGSFSFLAGTTPPGTLDGKIDVQGGFLDAVGMLPLGGSLSAFARIGANYADVSDTFTGTGAVHVLDGDRGKSAVNYKFGAGLQYRISRTFAARLEAERYRIDDGVGNRGDIDLFSLGLTYRPGIVATPVAAAVAAPTVAAPVPVVVAAPVRMSEYCAVLDFQFEINRDEIQREEREKLAVLGTFLRKYPQTTVVVEGHTDNVGTPANNLQLSQRRADSVVAYLRDRSKIEASRLSAVGYGDTRPLGDNLTEEGKRRNRRINAVVACAPDIAGLPVQPARITMALLIEFDRNQSDVRPQYRGELARVAEFLAANPSTTATVEGHTGNLQATPEEAMVISQQRAQHVVDYLVENFSIARSRLTAEGFGQTRRSGYNTTLEGQQDNRRVNVIINYR